MNLGGINTPQYNPNAAFYQVDEQGNKVPVKPSEVNALLADNVLVPAGQIVDGKPTAYTLVARDTKPPTLESPLVALVNDVLEPAVLIATGDIVNQIQSGNMDAVSDLQMLLNAVDVPSLKGLKEYVGRAQISTQAEIEKFLEGLAMHATQLEALTTKASKEILKGKYSKIKEKQQARIEEINQQIEDLRDKSTKEKIVGGFEIVGKVLAVAGIVALGAVVAVGSVGQAAPALIGMAIAITFLIDGETGGNVMKGLQKGVQGLTYAAAMGQVDFKKLEQASMWIAMAVVLAAEIATGIMAGGVKLPAALSARISAMSAYAGAKASNVASKAGQVASKVGQAGDLAGSFAKQMSIGLGRALAQLPPDVAYALLNSVDQIVLASAKASSAASKNIDDISKTLNAGLKKAATQGGKLGDKIETAQEALRRVMRDVMKSSYLEARNILKLKNIPEEELAHLDQMLNNMMASVLALVEISLTGLQGANQMGQSISQLSLAEIEKKIHESEAQSEKVLAELQLSQKEIDRFMQNFRQGVETIRGYRSIIFDFFGQSISHQKQIAQSVAS